MLYYLQVTIIYQQEGNMQQAVKKSVSFYPKEETIVSEYAKAKGLDFSSALRVIINDWDSLIAQPQPKPEPIPGAPS